MLDLTGATATVTPWTSPEWDGSSNAYPYECATVEPFYIQAASWSPDDSTIYIGTTGYHPNGYPTGATPRTGLCDAAAAFPATQGPVTHLWVNYTGCDSLYSTAADGSTAYFGGHERWSQNAGDCDAAGPGAIKAPGIEGLSPTTGLLTYNPTRGRGLGADDMLITSAGLWIASDNASNTNNCGLTSAGKPDYGHAASVSFPTSSEALMTGHAGPRIIYLGGLGRSGTTLIERMLNELPGIRSMGEVTHLWQRGVSAGERCGCGAPFHDCEFWRQVGELAFGGWDLLNVDHLTALQRRVDRTRHIPALARSHRRAAFQQALDEYLSYYLRLYQAIEKASGCQVVVNSSKHASLAFCLRAAPALDLRVVHVIRDSRAVAYSWSRQVPRPDAAGQSYMTVYDARTAAVQWNAQNVALHWLARLGVPVLRVRYEDFVRDPEQGVRDIAAFIGIGILRARCSSSGGARPTGGGNSAQRTPHLAIQCASSQGKSPSARTSDGRPRCPPATGAW